jgi:hypothetical protein
VDHWTSEWLPADSHDQSCALCGSTRVAWVHPLDGKLVTYRVYGKGHTLPGFWTTCEDCERRYAAGEDETLVALMRASGGFGPDLLDEHVDEVVRQPLAVFRRADLGTRPLPTPDESV